MSRFLPEAPHARAVCGGSGAEVVVHGVAKGVVEECAIRSLWTMPRWVWADDRGRTAHLRPCGNDLTLQVRETINSLVSLPPFQMLLDTHGLDVHRFLLSTVGRADADDCYQETWLAALGAYPNLRDASNLRGWLLTIAYRKAMDHIRAVRRRATPLEDLPELPSAGAAVLADDDLWSRIRALPAKQRTALTLRYVTDSAYGEISRLMGTSEDAARRNVHEGLKRLRLEYQR